MVLRGIGLGLLIPRLPSGTPLLSANVMSVSREGAWNASKLHELEARLLSEELRLAFASLHAEIR